MKTIALQGNTAYSEVRDSFGRWYWSANEPNGDLYDAEQMEKDHPPFMGSRLLFVRASDGEVFVPIGKKEHEALGEPLWYKRCIYIPCVNFEEHAVKILKWKPGKKYADTIAEIEQREIEDCYNLRLFASPLTLVRQKEELLQIVWPEKRRIEIEPRESFYLREGDNLYLSRWKEDPAYREETIIRNVYSGEIEAILPGDIQRQKNGELWHLSPNALRAEHHGISRGVLAVILVCALVLITGAAATAGLRYGTAVIPVYCASILLCACIGALLGKLVPIKLQLRLAMPVYAVISLGLASIAASHTGTREFLRIGDLEAGPQALITLLYMGGAYTVSKYTSYKFRHLGQPFLVLAVIPLVFALMFHSINWILGVPIAALLYAGLLTDENRFERGLRKPVLLYIIAVVGLLFTSPLWSKLIAPGIERPWTAEYMETLKQVQLLGTSSYTMYDMPAVDFYSMGSLRELPMAFLLKAGWIPGIIIFMSSIVLVWALYKGAARAANSYGRNLMLALAALYGARILLFASQFSLFSLAYFPLPLSGDFFQAMADAFVLAYAIPLCTKSENGESGIIDRERGVGSMLDRIIELTRNELGIEDDDWLTDEEYEEMTSSRKSLKEMVLDREALNEGEISAEEMLIKYGEVIGEKLAPGSYRRTLIFISYNHRDSAAAVKLARMLEENGEKAWYYERDIRYGSYPEQIMKALKQTKIFIVLISSGSNASSEVECEVFNAQKMNRDGLEILPLQIEDVELSDFFQHYLSRFERGFAMHRPIDAELKKFVQRVLSVSEEMDQKLNKQ